MVMQVKQVHSAFVKLIEGSQEPPLVYVDLMTICFSSSKSRNSWLFFWLVENGFCYSLSALLHSFFLLNRYEFLLG